MSLPYTSLNYGIEWITYQAIDERLIPPQFKGA